LEIPDRVGDKLELIVPHCDPAVNEYDHIYGTCKDRVEVEWPIFKLAGVWKNH